MPDESDNNEPPNWLVRIALDTDEMVSVPEVMAKFRYKVRQWARIHAKTKGPVFICFPSPERAPTLLEKYALISAIHDRICTNATPINPWDGLEDSLAGADESVVEAMKENLLRYSVAYDALLSVRVPQLGKCDSSIVEGWLEDVRAGLGLAPTTKVSHPPCEVKSFNTVVFQHFSQPRDDCAAQPSQRGEVLPTRNAEKRKTRKKAPVPKGIEMMGRAARLAKLIADQEQDDAGMPLNEMLRRADVRKDTFYKSKHFKEARADWHRLQSARQHHSKPGGGDPVDAPGPMLTCRSCDERFREYTCPKCGKVLDQCRGCHAESSHDVVAPH